MTATYDSIASTTLSVDTTTVTFSTIPGTYTDLLLVASAQRAVSGAGGAGSFTVNGDTGSNYSATLLYNDGNTVYSFRWSNQTNVPGIFSSGDGSYAPNFLHIQNYSNTATNKTFLTRFGFPGTNSRVAAGVGLWRSTAAITSISLTATSDFEAGSTFTLYGIKAE